MAKRKPKKTVKRKLRGAEIDRRIMDHLGRVELTATTEMVAKAVGVGWYTSQMHLVKLKDGGKVRTYRIGRQNQWILAERVERMEGEQGIAKAEIEKVAREWNVSREVAKKAIELDANPAIICPKCLKPLGRKAGWPKDIELCTCEEPK